MKVKDIYYFSGTHWDREWYQTFQGFRYRLVKMTDELLEHLENNSEFGVFHFDGQTIVLEDYNEIAPENAPRLKKLIADGRIKVGPWYNMPDEFLLSGESFIRNLMTGAKLAKKWGAEPWKYGYVCDIFGHIAQMPQIFNGFGIYHSILGRGTNGEDKTFFRWQSPDGSECINFVLEPMGGYGCYCQEVIEKSKDDEELRARTKAYLDAEFERSNTPVYIIMDAWDHHPIHKDTPKYIKIIKELYPDIHVHHSDLSEIQEKLDESRADLPVKAGELNKTSKEHNAHLHLITNTLSSYYTHKKMNDECQNELEKVIEPLMAFSSLCGKPYRRSFVDLAYKHLMQNHPHDSICGCSIEQVHKDMIYRFDQVKEIAAALCDEYVYQNRPQAGESGNYALKLYNPLPFARKETVTVDIPLKKDFPMKYQEPFGYEEIFSFKLMDSKGDEIPYGVVEMIKNYKKHLRNFMADEGECYRISFQAQMPPCGYCEYRLVPSEKPSRYLKKLDSGINYAENDYIRMEISKDGEISILDKKTNREYKNLCGFVDDGEIGDGWFHTNPVNDMIVYSKGGATRIEKCESSPARCVFKITKVLEIPSCIENLATGKKRSSEYIKIPITIEAGLSKEARYVDVKISFKNTARDHRLRLVLPTGVTNDTYYAGQTYYCNERKVGIDYATQDWREHEQYEKQMNGIVGKREEDGTGLAFVSANGLHECACLHDGSIYVTLLRAFQATIMTMGEDGGQLLTDLTYSFLLAPTDSEVTYSELVKLQDSLAVKPLSSVSETSADYAPGSHSHMCIEGKNILLSIVKLPEDGSANSLIVRVYNASGETSEGRIIFDREIQKVCMTNLNEKTEKEIPSCKKELLVSLEPWKIRTYKVSF